MLHKKFNQNLSTCVFFNKKLICFNIILKLKTIYGRTHRKKTKKKPCSYANMVKFCIYQDFVFIRNLELALQSWTKLLRQNRKSIFQEKNPSPPNQCYLQSFSLLITKPYQIQHC